MIYIVIILYHNMVTFVDYLKRKYKITESQNEASGGHKCTHSSRLKAIAELA